MADVSLSKKEKHKGSLSSLNKKAGALGGSLMSLGSKEKKNLKKLAKSVTHKVEKVGEKAKRSLSKTNVNKEESSALPNKFDLNREDSFRYEELHC